MADGDLQSVGEALRAAREAQGFSLQEVEAQTRIRLKFLRALEEGDADVLPSALHAKGFLRNYAQFLRLDADALAAQFDAATGHTSRPLTHLTETPAPYPPPGTRATPPVLVESEAPTGEPPPEADEAAEAEAEIPADETQPPAKASEAGDVEGVEPAIDAEPAAAPEPGEETPPADELPELAPPPPPRLARSTFIPTSQRVGPGVPRGLAGQPPPAAAPPPGEDAAPPAEGPPAEERRQRSPAARTMRSNVFAITMLVLAFAAIVWFVTNRLSQISGEAFLGTTESTAEPLVDTQEGSAGADATATALPTASTSEPDESVEVASVAGRVVLSIDVVQRSWVRVEVDGEMEFEGQALVGEVLLYEGEDSILIRVGNGAGLDATVNGEAFGPLGERGEVVERLFTPDGEEEPPADSGGDAGPPATPGDAAETTATPGGEPTGTPTPPPTPEP